ncbi:SusD/RagB family nutrient-binding outer membrane lipoprotein [Ohtaekwangia kribbensis]|uniref:SusD/RagB family nutrient-binding outer membrane lipoprotein n=1 Tax=Ohtaekwangia kribbensis TaxID=688913 RepID=A0ABW3KA48_9BACT
MKKKFIYYILSAMAVTIMSCGDDYLDVNTNPNQAVSATPETVLTNALNVTASRLVHHEIGAFWVGQWSPSGSVSGFTPEKTYDIQTTFRTGIWTSPYNNLEDYKYVEETALKQGKQAIAGIARVMKAFNFQIIVDAYNNAPYSEALKGTVAIRPAYDNGSAIYDSLIRDINVAITYLSVPISSTNPSASSADIYFNGDNALWVKFANTLKLRMLLRLTNVSDKQALIASELASFKSNTVFLDSGENVSANPGYLKTAGKENPWYENYGYSAADQRAGSHDFYCWSNFFISFLSNTQDSVRIKLLTYPVGTGTDKKIIGVPFGEGNDTYLYSKISGFGPAFLPNDNTVKASSIYKNDQIVMSAAESFFLQAEAVQRGLLTSNLSAQQLYEKGVAQSYYTLASQADTTTLKNSWPSSLGVKKGLKKYLSSGINNVDWSASSNKIEAIITQKWIALANYGGFEAWTEYRRTGIPNVPLSTRAQGTQHPARLLYPLSEYSNNADNVSAQGDINQFTSKIFWDAQ